ncbi:unnamed protein product [Arctia plantaginis]|uniref:Uncharacterized protein n=1 Tax=Arctia plantaginis TaxID=874455 RepID=A0A8S0YR09_ARCPL|nr:unnamed protein product [Arctia plantaginis]
MGDIQAGQNLYVFLISGITIFFCVALHVVYKIVFSSKKKEALKHEVEPDTGAPIEETNSDAPITENRTLGKSKKRALWKGKSEFTHPWLLKNLKGHPGTVLLVDFSANGKFMAATCDGKFPYIICT